MGKAELSKAAYDSSIFLNCPFDQKYKPIFDALVFAAFDCGFVPRCALEVDDGGQVRVEKIISIIRAVGSVLTIFQEPSLTLITNCLGSICHLSWGFSWGPPVSEILVKDARFA